MVGKYRNLHQTAEDHSIVPQRAKARWWIGDPPTGAHSFFSVEVRPSALALCQLSKNVCPLNLLCPPGQLKRKCSAGDVRVWSRIKVVSVAIWSKPGLSELQDKSPSVRRRPTGPFGGRRVGKINWQRTGLDFQACSEADRRERLRRGPRT